MSSIFFLRVPLAVHFFLPLWPVNVVINCVASAAAAVAAAAVAGSCSNIAQDKRMQHEHDKHSA